MRNLHTSSYYSLNIPETCGIVPILQTLKLTAIEDYRNHLSQDPYSTGENIRTQNGRLTYSRLAGRIQS